MGGRGRPVKGSRRRGWSRRAGAAAGAGGALRGRPALQVRRERLPAGLGGGRAFFPFLSAGLGGCPAAGSVPAQPPCAGFTPGPACFVPGGRWGCSPVGRWRSVSGLLAVLPGVGSSGKWRCGDSFHLRCLGVRGCAGAAVGAAHPCARREGRPSWDAMGENAPCVNESRGECAPVRSHCFCQTRLFPGTHAPRS